MSKNLSDIDERNIDKAIDSKGILVATIEPSKDSKGSWSEIFKVDDTYYNRVYSDTQDAWMVLIEELDDKNEILRYKPDAILSDIK